MKKEHSPFLIPGIVMIGIALRAPFTVLPIVLTDIAEGLGKAVCSCFTRANSRLADSRI